MSNSITDDLSNSSWRIRVQHRTDLAYSSAVGASYNEARLTPSAINGQLVISSRIDVKPSTRLESYIDYWGTVVHTFDIQNYHDDLSIMATSLVDTVPLTIPSSEPDWESLADPKVIDRWCEYLGPSGLVTMDAELNEFIAELRSAPDPTSAVSMALDIVSEHLHYRPGSTTVRTTDIDAWRSAEGVCQDYSHLTIALLRGAGIPARYASGYLHPGIGEIGATVIGESHAWIEAWLGEWRAFDPTNHQLVGERHVLVGLGRDYTDVPPLKGIFSGGESEHHRVEVELTRLAR